eukprot:TRINITY_DN14645_c0_g1_i3.p1 TRINITY_DN14645_c0_g1~~TRINITY_DN14645_c0_g1_i3.p1  ORF type:complete len:748 (+),score=85.92 TRINITY_DN14645_c0_g1_i3:37-2280(+)
MVSSRWMVQFFQASERWITWTAFLTGCGLVVASLVVGLHDLDVKCRSETSPVFGNVCSGCPSFSLDLNVSSWVTNCSTAAEATIIWLCVIWSGLGTWFWLSSSTGSDIMLRHSRNQLFFTLVISLIATIQGGGYNWAYYSVTVGISEGLHALLVTFWLVYIMAAFPSQLSLLRSRKIGMMNAWLVLTANLLARYGSGYATLVLMFLLGLNLCIFVWAVWGKPRRLPACGEQRSILKQVFMPLSRLWRRMTSMRDRPEILTAPGALTSVAFGINLLYILVFGMCNLLIVVADQDSVTDEHYECSEYQVSGSLVDAFQWFDCSRSIILVLRALLTTPLLMGDMVIHQHHWEGSLQLAIANKFADINWNIYLYRPEEYQISELLAAGSTGEVHLAQLTAQRSHGNDQQICVKIPHVTGAEGLSEVLEEAAVLMQIQARVDPADPGKKHILPLIGFCVELPTVATLFPYCQDGDLLHALDQARPLVDRESDTERRVTAEPRRSDWFVSSRPSPSLPPSPLPGRATPDRGSFADAATVPIPDGNPMMTMGSCKLAPWIQKQGLQCRLRWGLEVATGLRLLHLVGVAHLDVKTDNVLLMDGEARIIDLGCAYVRPAGISHSRATLKPNTGTPAFTAPELVSDQDSSTLTIDPFAADMFSFGFLLYECVTFEREPVCRRQQDDLSKPLEVHDDEMDGEWGHCPREVVDLVRRCFAKLPEKRPGPNEAVMVLQQVLQEDEAAPDESEMTSACTRI